jgi:UDP-3-O-[3-hydroxymyristoyl] glucosamine N-acyltransferase
MRLIILGAGGYGHVIEDIAIQSEKYEEILFLDDNSQDKCSTFIQYKKEDTEFYPAFGNNAIRMEWLRRLEENQCRIASFIHLKAYVSPKAKIEAGSVLLPFSVVNTNTVIGKGSIINCGAIIDHDCIIREGCHICLNATIKANNTIPACTKIEAGEIIENNTYR